MHVVNVFGGNLAPLASGGGQRYGASDGGLMSVCHCCHPLQEVCMDDGEEVLDDGQTGNRGSPVQGVLGKIY